MRAHSAKSIKPLRASELNIAFLKVARGHIVEAGISDHERQSVVGIAEMRATAADNQREFAFVFHALRIFCQHDRFFRTNDGRGWLEEHQRLFRDFIAQLRGVRGVIAADAYDLRRLDGSEQPHLAESRRARTARPGAPGRPGDFDDILAFDQSIARRSRVRRGSFSLHVTADFHWCSACVMVVMRLMRFTGSPDHANNPAERGEYHIHDRSHHKNMERAEPVAETMEYEAERAITQAENQPAKKARCHEMPGQAQKPKNGNRGEKTQDRGGGDIALHRKAIQERGAIGNHQPCGEHQSQTNANINAGADCRIAENVEPTITGQMRTYQHKVLGSQDTSNSLIPDLRRWLRDLDHNGRAWRAFISRAVHGGHGVPIAVAGLYRGITNRRRGQ